jgi:hypothetical protein
MDIESVDETNIIVTIALRKFYGSGGRWKSIDGNPISEELRQRLTKIWVEHKWIPGCGKG